MLNTRNIVLLRFGSHLYGTATEKSDTDIKGVFTPRLRDCVLNKIPKSLTSNTKSASSAAKNTSKDIDYEKYSIHYFLQLGFKGETVFLDMIHAPKNMLLETSPEWDFLQKNKQKFYTKNLKSYLGYCRGQAAKYGIKGSRLADAERVLEYLKIYANTDTIKLSSFWDNLPEGEHIKKYDFEDARNSGDVRCYDVCGKKLMANTPVREAMKSIELFVNNYGARAKLAKENSGIDWKAVSHALRAGYQLKSLYEHGDIVFPLKEAPFLLDVKQGNLHYVHAGIGEKLEEIISEVEELSSKSSYPESVDQEFWNNWLIQDVYNTYK